MCNCYAKLGRREEEISLRREIYATRAASAPTSELTLSSAFGLAEALNDSRRPELVKEAKAFLRKVLPSARRVLDPNNRALLQLQLSYAKSMNLDEPVVPAEIRESIVILEDLERRSLRIYGAANHMTSVIQGYLSAARRILITEC